MTSIVQESFTFQAIIEKGRQIEKIASRKETLFMQGERLFGQPTAYEREWLNQITDVAVLDKLL